jgi:ADP-ribosylglycohydrolase
VGCQTTQQGYFILIAHSCRLMHTHAAAVAAAAAAAVFYITITQCQLMQSSNVYSKLGERLGPADHQAVLTPNPTTQKPLLLNCLQPTAC